MGTHPFISIITPTYNRSALLGRCYTSLLAQTDLDFQWIIVDDGSTDDTQALVSSFQTELFPITYIRKPNGGKHTALNAAHDSIKGEYVLILDSDDYLTENAIQMVRNAWQKYSEDLSVGIVTFLKGKTVDDPLCVGKIADRPVDMRKAMRTVVHGNDCCEVLRTELFLKYPFPVFPGERFVSECALWDRIAENYKCVYINQVIYICDYLEGGLTRTGKKLQISNPQGGMFTSEQRMDKGFSVKNQIKYGLLYVCYGFFAGMSVGKMLKKTKHRFLVALCLFPGYLLYRYWKRKYLRCEK